MEITGIHLVHWGDHAVVHAEIDGQWVPIIEAPLQDLMEDGAFSLIADQDELKERLRLSM